MAMDEREPWEQRRRPRQARSRATVATLLEATARILRNEGEAALSTNLVAARAGVGIGSLYDYFPDKAALIEALAERLMDEDAAAVDAALEAAQAEPGNDPLARVVHVLVARHRSDRALRRVVLGWHLRAGHAAAQARRAEAAIARAGAAMTGGPPPDPARAFVAAGAVLGVCRALTAEDHLPAPRAEIEAQLTALARDALGHG